MINLNATQKNLLFAAGTAAVAAAGPVGPLSVLSLFAQPALAATKFTKDRSVLAKIGQATLGFGLSFVAIGVGGSMNPTFETQTQVAEAPAPVEQVTEVAEAPAAPVAIIPAGETPWAAPAVDPATVVDPVKRGPFTTTSHWADAADTTNSGTATYNTDTDTVTWHTTAFGQTDKDSCSNGKHHLSGLSCTVTYNADGLPTRVVVTDDYDGYRISTTTFRF